MFSSLRFFAPRSASGSRGSQPRVSPGIVLSLMALLGAGALASGALASGCCTSPKCPTCARPRVVEPPPQPQPPRRVHVRTRAPRAWPFACKKGLAIVRRQLRAHIHLSELLGWYTRTQGEASMQKVLFVGREQLISRRTLAYLKECLAEAKAPVERRSIEYMRDYIAMAYIDRRTAALEDDIAAAAIGAKARLSWKKTPVAYRQLPVLLSGEKSPKRRAEIAGKMAEIQQNVLNPLLQKLVMRSQELAQWMGYPSYVALSAQVRRVDLARQIRLGARFVKKSQPLFQTIMTQVAKENLGVPLAKLRRADHARLFRAAKVERQLPRQLMIPAFRYFLAGIGLNMTTAAKTRIRVDDTLRPKKNPRAACFPLVVPSDIRISVKPVGGLASWVTFFHEGGHALHFAWTTTPRFAFQQLGSNGFTEAMAELFARAWEEPAWLERYTRFVREVNRGKHRDLLPKGARIRRVPTLSKRLRGYLIRNRLAYNLYLARRYGWAKLIYETALYGGPESLYRAAYKGPTSDRRTLYGALFSKAYGYPLTRQDTARYLADVDPFFYSADYARAFQLADLLHEHLRAKFGPAWFSNPKVGAYLKTLWATGNKLTPEELARRLGKTLDYSASLARLGRLWAAAEVLSGHRKAPRKGAHRKPCRPTPHKPGKCKAPY